MDTGEIRFLWKITVSLILTLVLIVISRLTLILVVQQVFMLQGMTSSIAFQNAQVFVSESTEGQAIASSLDLVLILLLVFFIVTRFDKRKFHLTELGMDVQRNTLPLVGLGLVIGCILFLGIIIFGVLLGTFELPLSLNLSQWPYLSTLFASIAFYFLNSFWQEALFRGYLQTRAVEKFGRFAGVTAISVIFVVFHGLVQTLTIIGIITGILLFLFIGLLYDKTRSLYFVAVIHAVLNFMPSLFTATWQGLEIAMIYGIALIVLLLGIHQNEKRTKTETNQIQEISTLHATQ